VKEGLDPIPPPFQLVSKYKQTSRVVSTILVKLLLCFQLLNDLIDDHKTTTQRNRDTSQPGEPAINYDELIAMIQQIQKEKNK
jgi:hypothetical protein